MVPIYIHLPPIRGQKKLIFCARTWQWSIKFGQTKLCTLARPMDGWPMWSDNHEDHSSTWWICYTLRTFIQQVLYILRSTYHDITRFVAHSTNLSNIPSLVQGFEDVHDYARQGCIPESKTEGSRRAPNELSCRRNLDHKVKSQHEWTR